MLRDALLKAADGNRLAASGCLKKKIQKQYLVACHFFWVDAFSWQKYQFPPWLKYLFTEQNIYASI